MDKRIWYLCLVVPMAVSASCADKDPAGHNPDDFSRVDCQKPGTAHSGTIANAVWLADDSPHQLRDTVIVSGTLTIEAGALVCGAPAGLLRIGKSDPPEATGVLLVPGTQDRPVVFTAADPVSHWGGITVETPTSGSGSANQSRASMSHIRMELADRGFSVDLFTSAIVENSHFRRASIWGGSTSLGRATIELRNSVVDTATVLMADGVFEDNIIRGGGLTLDSNSGGHVLILGGRIEDSPGVGLKVGNRNFFFREPDVTVSRPLRIVSSHGYAVDMPLDKFQMNWSTRAAQESLLGNWNDTLSLWSSGGSNGDLLIRRDLPWQLYAILSTSPIEVTNLTIEAGGSLDLTGRLVATGAVTAVGTIAEPITIKSSSQVCSSGCGILLRGSSTSRFSNVFFSDVHLDAAEQHTTHVERIHTTNFINLAAPGSSVMDSELSVIAGSDTPGAALLLAADAIRADRIVVRHSSGSGIGGVPIAGIAINASNVHVQSCDVTDNQSDGIRVLSGTDVQIHDCNIERNGGVGVSNQSSFVVDARRNWWGDPSGPLGPNGDGVAGVVDFGEFLTSPIERSTAIHERHK